MTQNSKFKKTEAQQEAIKLFISNALEILLLGGSRSGKTSIAIYAILTRAIKNTSRHVIARRYFSDAKKAIWLDSLPKILKLAYPGVPYKSNSTDYYIKFPHNDSEVWVGGLDNEERAEKILGREYSTVFLNEVSQIDYSSVETIITRLAEKNELEKKLYLDMNPPGKRHWSYKKYILGRDPISNLEIDKSLLAWMKINPYQNAENLDKNYLRVLENLSPEKKKRFLHGEFQDDVAGEVFDTSSIKRISLNDLPADLDRIVIGHDPAVTSKITSDEHGLIVAARKGNIGYIIKDSSGIYTPEVAAQKSIADYNEHECDLIVSEVNNGGDYIKTILHQYDPFVSHKNVRATRGKVKRAEPVASLYNQGRIYHVGEFPDLETEMSEFKIDEKEMEYSPNRCDAMCWAITELFDLYSGQPRFRSL
ncbi:MAG: phage terminase large subunit [Thermoplasmatales archaeon]|nr:MAG: phage terminase large subunit [Thermoplasmatales archaeon]